MESTRSLEIKIGLLVVASLSALVAVILTADRFDFESEYTITVFLSSAEGLKVGSPVTLSGHPGWQRATDSIVARSAR